MNVTATVPVSELSAQESAEQFLRTIFGKTLCQYGRDHTFAVEKGYGSFEDKTWKG